MSARDENPDAEETGAGSQTDMSGVMPIRLRDRLGVLAVPPMASSVAQKRCDHGLVDFESRLQIDLVDELRRLNRNDDLIPPITDKGE